MSARPFPPAPWFLGGDLLVSLWLGERDRVPATARSTLPKGWRPVLLGGRPLLGTALAHYSPGGVLAYEEVLLAVLVRRGARLRVWIPQIWVTSAASVAGGRALWGIPKHLARIERVVGPGGRLHASMHAATARVDLDADVGRQLLPGQIVLPLPTAQRLAEATTLATNTVTAVVRGARARWHIEADGVLGTLAGRRPLASVLLSRAAVTFGRDVVRR